MRKKHWTAYETPEQRKARTAKAAATRRGKKKSRRYLLVASERERIEEARETPAQLCRRFRLMLEDMKLKDLIHDGELLLELAQLSRIAKDLIGYFEEG